MMRTLSCTLLLIMSFSANAQQFRGGISLGANFAQIDGDNHSGYNKMGAKLGFIINKPINEKNSVQFEMLISQKGSRLTFKDSTGGANPVPNTVFRLNYVEVPFIYRYHIKPKFIAEGGLSFGILYGSKMDVGAGFEKTEGIKRMDYLGNIGLCYAFSETVLLNWRLQYSLTTIADQQKPQNANFIRTGVYNNVTSLSLQFFFR